MFDEFIDITDNELIYNVELPIEMFMKRLLKTSQHNSDMRLKKGRLLAGENNLTIDILVGMWREQGGRCYYSGIKMSLQILSEWKASLERKDVDKGYTKDNVCLIVAELNGPVQWTKDKMQELLEKRLNCDTNYSLLSLESITKETKDKLMELIHGSKSHLKRINNTRNTYLKNEVTIEHLITKLNNQKGRCYYSGLKMILTRAESYMVSLERLDSQEGYTVDNTVLICSEWNTPDREVAPNKHGVKVGKSGGWTKEKVDFLFEQFELIKTNPNQPLNMINFCDGQWRKKKRKINDDSNVIYKHIIPNLNTTKIFKIAPNINNMIHRSNKCLSLKNFTPSYNRKLV